MAPHFTIFSRLSQLRNLTTEARAVQVDLRAFASTVAYPSSPMTLCSGASQALSEKVQG